MQCCMSAVEIQPFTTTPLAATYHASNWKTASPSSPKNLPAPRAERRVRLASRTLRTSRRLANRPRRIWHPCVYLLHPLSPLCRSVAINPHPLADYRQRPTRVHGLKMRVLVRNRHFGPKKSVATNRLLTKIVWKVDYARFQETLGVGALLVAPRAVVQHGRVNGALHNEKESSRCV